MTYTAGHEAVESIAALVCAARPEWEHQLVKVILLSHAMQVDGTDLAIAALRCAANPDMPGPKAIGWRGPHWRDLGTCPPEMKRPEVCDICRKPEPRCWSERPGPDDHVFVPIARAS